MSKSYFKKSIILLTTSVLAVSGIFSFAGIADANRGGRPPAIIITITDNVGPVITLIGESVINVTQGEVYVDQGATALDEVKGVVEVTTTGSVDTAIVATYIITYTAHDDAFNVTTATRTVNVVAPVVLSSIAITTPATKLIFTVGDTLDTAGLEVTGTYSNSSTSTLVIESVTGFDSTAPAVDQVLTVTSNGMTTTYTVNIIAVVVTPPTSGGGGGGGYVAPATKAGDITGDGVIGENDFSVLMSQWGQAGSGLSADLNKDGVVDENDFSILMANWTV